MSLFTETDRSLFAQTTRAASPEDRVSAHARPVVTARCMLMIDVAHCMAVNWRLYNDKTGATSDVSVFHLPQLANVILVPLYKGWGGKDWGRGGGLQSFSASATARRYITVTKLTASSLHL